jgi:hypothetical protein
MSVEKPMETEDDTAHQKLRNENKNLKSELS